MTSSIAARFAGAFRGKLLVSCQAPAGSALADSSVIARIAAAVVAAGAAGIRAEAPANIASIRKAVTVPIIGISKEVHNGGAVLITPSLESARALVCAGASMIAVECTSRGQRSGALDRVAAIRRELGVPVLADIATLSEAEAAEAAGADFILTTMRGYTPETEDIHDFDPAFVREVSGHVGVPVIAEGRIATPSQARDAFEAGAHAIIIGSAITRPDLITRKFIFAIGGDGEQETEVAIGVDLGSTDTKFGIARLNGSLLWQDCCPTPALSGRDALLDHLATVIAHCRKAAATRNTTPAGIGVATGGWVDPVKGRVIYATGNLPHWSGTEIRTALEQESGLPVAVENDANAMAVAEKRFGLAKSASTFVSVTLGTGVGGGCYIGGRLHRGANCLGNAIGHIVVQPDGLECNCGQRGCLEVYENAAALVRYAGPPFRSAAEVACGARQGHAAAQEAIRTYAAFLARGLAVIANMIDPELIVLSGGVAESSPLLIEEVSNCMRRLVVGWSHRRIRLAVSALARFGGVSGAAAVAFDELDRRPREAAG